MMTALRHKEQYVVDEHGEDKVYHNDDEGLCVVVPVKSQLLVCDITAPLCYGKVREVICD